MQKKIFFLLFSLELGGVEKSLINLIKSTKYINCKIHVGLINIKGELLNHLPENVVIHKCCNNIWDEINLPPLSLIRKKLKKGKFLEAISISILYYHYKLTGEKNKYFKYILRNEKPIDIEFYEAHAYAGPSSIIDYYIVNKINAKNKYGWVHFDISKIGIEYLLTKKLYKSYKYIYIVSYEAKKIFDKYFPEYKLKSVVKNNLINKNEVLYQSKLGKTFDDNFKGTRILTVGRISYEKGQDIAIHATKILIDLKFNIKWYFIGDGYFLQECKNIVNSLKLDNYIIFLGAQLNPYRYMKECDIYIQPSRHEGYCISLSEAKIFNKPIIATNFTNAKESLKNYNGIVTKGMCPEDLAISITKFL